MRTAHSTAPHAAPPQRRSAAPQTWDIPSRPPASTRSAAHRTARRGRPPRRPAAYVPGAIPRGALALSIRNNWEQEFFSTSSSSISELSRLYRGLLGWAAATMLADVLAPAAKVENERFFVSAPAPGASRGARAFALGGEQQGEPGAHGGRALRKQNLLNFDRATASKRKGLERDIERNEEVTRHACCCVAARQGERAARACANVGVGSGPRKVAPSRERTAGPDAWCAARRTPRRASTFSRTAPRHAARPLRLQVS